MISDETWTLARISGTYLGIEDHGCLVFYLYLDYADPGGKIGGTCQGFGGRILWMEKGGTAASIEMIARCLLAAGSEDWEHLKGRMVWAQHTHNEVYRIKGLDTGVVCDLKEIAEKMKEQEAL